MPHFLKQHSTTLIAIVFACIIGTVSFFINYFIILFHTDYRIEDLEQEHLHKIIASFVSFVFTLLIAYLYYQRSNMAYKVLYVVGATLPLCFNTYVLAALLPVFIDKSNYYEEFESDRWYAYKPFKMARKLSKDKHLIGISQDSLITLLGWGKKSQEGQTTYMEYQTAKKYHYLIVKIEKDTVTESYLYEQWKH
jgi:hypothetical protein